MNRRSFFAAVLGVPPFCSLLVAALPKAKITRVRYYKTPTDAAGRPNTRQPLFNQSTNVVIIETDAGLTGVGEGGAENTMEQCAGMLIGEDPFRTDYLWQMMYRGYFYPAGREKIHALGALDVALWDLKAKALGVPVYQLLGGLSRNHVECYSTGWPGPGTPTEKARACIESGFRAYRISMNDARGGDRFDAINYTYEHCKQVREGA